MLDAMVTSEHDLAALAARGRAFLAAPHAASSLGWQRGRAIPVCYCLCCLARAPGETHDVPLSTVSCCRLYCPPSLDESCYNRTPLGKRQMREKVATFWGSWQECDHCFNSLFTLLHGYIASPILGDFKVLPVFLPVLCSH